ncbi:ABC transporter permease subunit [Bacillus timonensis]|nr:ABC transporter permease subunit [Bacillus timonensis]
MHNKSLIIGTIMTVLLVITMVFGPYLPFIDAELSGERVKFPEPGKIETAPFPPSDEYLLGTDKEGRDLLSLIVVGTKDTILIIFAITLLRYIIAVPLALIASKQVGPISWFIKWWHQLFSSLPIIFSTILLVNLPFLMFSEQRYIWCIVIIALIEVGKVAFITQQQAHALSKAAFVEAGITLGVTPLGLIIRYYIPNLLPEIIVNFFIDLSRVALLIGQLGILSIFIMQEFVQLNYGAGEVINTNFNWATLLGQARHDVLKAFWIPFFPALALTFTILSFNILAEGLRQHFNRRTANI